jgi:hypothetical protein
MCKFWALQYILSLYCDILLHIIYVFPLQLLPILTLNLGSRRSVGVKALCYKPEGYGFDTR